MYIDCDLFYHWAEAQLTEARTRLNVSHSPNKASTIAHFVTVYTKMLPVLLLHSSTRHQLRVLMLDSNLA
jgi:hypothetical protein